MKIDPIIEEDATTLAALDHELKKDQIPCALEGDALHVWQAEAMPLWIKLDPGPRQVRVHVDLNWRLDNPDEASMQAYCDGIRRECLPAWVFPRALEREGRTVWVFTARWSVPYWDGMRINRLLKLCRNLQRSMARNFQALHNPDHQRPVEAVPGLLERAREAILYYQSASASKLQQAIGVGWERCNEVLTRFEGDLISTPQSDGQRTVLPRLLDLTHTDHPPNTYWLEPDALLAGEYPGAGDPDATRRQLLDLLDRGFTIFVDLTEAGELCPYEPMLVELARESGIACEYHRMPIPKLGVPADPGLMQDWLLQLNAWQRKNQKTYLHGDDGAGRTSMVAGCYVQQSRCCRDGEAALAHLQLLWTRMGADRQQEHPRIPSTQAQRDYVLNWDALTEIINDPLPRPQDSFDMTWFKRLTGFDETDYETTRAQLRVEGNRLRSLANDRSWQIGTLETPSLAELRERAVPALVATRGTLSVRNITADAHQLHTRPELKGALIQVASQFNLLEMPNYHITPEHGVRHYEDDRTQGPACACAAGPATIYRNYFAPVGDQIGQTKERQIDTLADLRAALPGGEGIEMRNGYALADEDTLRTIRAALEACDATALDALRARLRIGLHHDVEVTAFGAPRDGHHVSQAYCSALPLSYNRDSEPELWESFACLVLDAAYETTLLAAVLNAARPGGSRKVYLTLVGGGVFGNRREWILDAIRRALDRVRGQALDVRLVSYEGVPADLEALARAYES